MTYKVYVTIIYVFLDILTYFMKTAYIHASALFEENHNNCFNVFNCFVLMESLLILMWCNLATENVTKQFLSW